MKTLADKYPEVIERFETVGFTAIAALCRRHYRVIDMDRQLGTTSSVSKWLTGKNLPSHKVEERARKMLNEECSAPDAPVPAAPDDNMLMVVCPSGSSAKVQRVLAMLGCEVEVI